MLCAHRLELQAESSAQEEYGSREASTTPLQAFRSRLHSTAKQRQLSTARKTPGSWLQHIYPLVNHDLANLSACSIRPHTLRVARGLLLKQAWQFSISLRACSVAFSFALPLPFAWIWADLLPVRTVAERYHPRNHCFTTLFNSVSSRLAYGRFPIDLLGIHVPDLVRSIIILTTALVYLGIFYQLLPAAVIIATDVLNPFLLGSV